MRVILLLFLFTICSTGNTTTDDTVDIGPYQIIGDSIFLKNGTTCHIDNFTNGKCEIEENWWDINYLSFWTGLLIPFAFFGYIVIAIKRKINNRRTG
jgi:hypothetical protein|tara:strand:+ start:10 stop:300 length:291 start_codon:yes stop_codon:yes gene_type:complete